MVDKSNYKVVRKNVYDEYHGNVSMQFLKRRKLSGLFISWEIIDCEVIPEQYLIDMGTMGYSPIEWQSKFIEYIPKSRGGLLEG